MQKKYGLEFYFSELIRGKRKGFLPFILRFFLRCFSWVYKIGVICRNWAFDHGWLRRYFPPVPVVISIGNIVAGGTGKTPITLMLAQEFYRDFTIAVLSRGYRSQAENLQAPVVLCKGEGPMHSALHCGDEPYLIAQYLPKAFVFVGKDRHKASNMAAKAGAHLILLDDGMQHRRLARDFEVVVMDSLDPFGQGFFLPRGFLREGLKSLSRADLIILNHIYDQTTFTTIKEQLKRYSSAPVVGTQMEVVKVYDHLGNPIELIKDQMVGIFCAIAHPEYFQKTIQNLGAQIVDHYYIADHKSFNSHSLKQFSLSCSKQGANLLLCTEKDWVKLDDSLKNSLSIGWVQTRLRLVEGNDDWKKFIEKAKSDLSRRI